MQLMFLVCQCYFNFSWRRCISFLDTFTIFLHTSLSQGLLFDVISIPVLILMNSYNSVTAIYYKCFMYCIGNNANFTLQILTVLDNFAICNETQKSETRDSKLAN